MSTVDCEHCEPEVRMTELAPGVWAYIGLHQKDCPVVLNKQLERE